MTRLQTKGNFDARRKAISRERTIMDGSRVFQQRAFADQTGWDWFGLSLADGNDLMIYRLRSRTGGDDFLSGTIVKPTARRESLPPPTFR